MQSKFGHDPTLASMTLPHGSTDIVIRNFSNYTLHYTTQQTKKPQIIFNKALSNEFVI